MLLLIIVSMTTAETPVLFEAEAVDAPLVDALDDEEVDGVEVFAGVDAVEEDFDEDDAVEVGWMRTGPSEEDDDFEEEVGLFVPELVEAVAFGAAAGAGVAAGAGAGGGVAATGAGAGGS
ncbi:MAG: hypothetical protein ACK4YP_07365, partial [Myxococcota bacterium]